MERPSTPRCMPTAHDEASDPFSLEIGWLTFLAPVKWPKHYTPCARARYGRLHPKSLGGRTTGELPLKISIYRLALKMATASTKDASVSLTFKEIKGSHTCTYHALTCMQWFTLKVRHLLALKVVVLYTEARR